MGARSFRGEAVRRGGVLAAFAIALLAALPASGESPALKRVLAGLAATKGPFTFAVLGDNRSGDRVYRKVMALTMARAPLVVLNTGDVIPNPGNLEQWARFHEESKVITAPYFLAPGNHDIDDRKSEAVWREQTDLPGLETFYAFTVGESLFVALNSCESDADRRIVGNQLAWLERTLDPARYERQFVFLHHPLFLWKEATREGEGLDKYPKDRDRLHDLFVRKRVDAVFVGHEHTYHRQDRDGVLYVVTGGAGAPLYGRESFNHVLFVRVEGPRLAFQVIDRDGVLRDEFTRVPSEGER